MASPPAPIKPPRGVKYGKESNGCGLLVTVIKTLDASETNEERQKEKLKIEGEFKKTDQKLNDLVAKHDGDLTKTMHLFGQISTQITMSRERIHNVKENLQACKQLLRCRRDELKKLWTDAVQQKYILEMLEQINELRKVPSLTQSYIAKRQYLHATKTLSNAIQLGNDKLRDVEGLNDLRQDLELRKNQLYTKLLDELKYHLYELSTMNELSNFQRHGSTRNSNFSTSPFQRNIVRRSAERAEVNTKINNLLVDMKQNLDIDKTEIIDDMQLLDADLSSTYFIGIIVECFSMLEKVPDSLETIKVQIQPELLNIITKSSQQIVTVGQINVNNINSNNNNINNNINNNNNNNNNINNNNMNNSNNNNNNNINNNNNNINNNNSNNNNNNNSEIQIHHPLLDLIELIYKQFKLIADVHTLLLKNYSNLVHRHSLSIKLYDINDYWSEAQTALQLLLTDYLDIQNITLDERSTSNFIEQSNNINNFFNRRKIQSKKTLFKFEKSSHINTNEDSSVAQQLPNSGVKEHRRNASDMSTDDILLVSTGSERKKRDKLMLVCQPDASLIRVLYLPLTNIISEIQGFMKCKIGQPCTLNTFLSNHIKETFLAKGHNRNLQIAIESLSKNHDAWRTIITPEIMKNLGLSRPLLQNTVMVENKITETRDLIKDLPNYSEDLLKMVCSLLKTYRETCQAAYRGIVQPETEDKRIYSVAWLKDEDISRFLKTLPNWTDLKTSNQMSRLMNKRKAFKKASSYMASEDESPTQIQQRNIREAEMLTSNLGESGISQQEILSDISVLKELAILQESMEWFSSRISEFANDLRKPILNGYGGFNINNDIHSPVMIKEGTIKVLTNLALEFDDLANTCLLVLHLEVRVQCFHYLRTNPSDKLKGNNYNNTDLLEPDSKVLKLTKVLSEMDEALSSTLHPRKTKYIFEGLAHLASRILIMASNYMESIDQAGVQRMCRNALALQQTLSSITASREIALDHAKNFYEMLYMSPEEILTKIIERGPQFTEMQYLNALQLSCKGNGIVDFNAIANYQQKLSDILGTKPALGITV